MSRASAPDSRRHHHHGIPAVPPVEIADDPTPTPAGNVVRLRWRGLNVLVQGAQALYAAGLIGLGGAALYLVPGLVSSLREATRSLETAASELHVVSADAREARAAAGRAEQGLEGLRGEVAGVRRDVADLRRDLATTCTPKPR